MRIKVNEKKLYPVIVTEYLQNGSLEDLLDYERKDCKIPSWEDTMKLINILRIASSMSYLHSLIVFYFQKLLIFSKK